MPEVAYVPSSEYAKRYETAPINKENIIAGIVKYGYRKSFSGVRTDGSSLLIYTVPENTTFFLVSAILHIHLDGATTVQSGLLYFGTGEVLLSVYAIDFECPSENVTLSPVIPVVLKSGEKLYVSNSALNCLTAATVTGYEVQTELIPEFV
jgi:hypothetical protein